MNKLLKLFLTLGVVTRFVRNTLAALLAQLATLPDHHVGWSHVAFSALVGAITAAAKGVRDAYPKWGNYLPV